MKPERTTMMRSTLKILLLPILLTACDLGLGTGLEDVTLDELAEPQPNTAVVVVSEPLGDGSGHFDMQARTQYVYALRTPPPLPELLYDAQVSFGASTLSLVLADVDQTGVLVTGTDGVEVLFSVPDGTLFVPLSTCRINITSAWADSPGSRLQGKSDCPVTDGTIDFRVLFKFDYTVPAG